MRELEEYGVIKGEHRAGVRYYDETEREIVRAVTELARYGVGGRNLRVFRTSADREAALLQQILAPALRSRNPEAPQGGDRDAREPRRRHDAPQAPAADPRPAQDRRLTPAAAVDLRARIRDIPDFPKPGIVFKDITPLLADPAALDAAVDAARRTGRGRGRRPRRRRRGARLHPRRRRSPASSASGFVPARKPGKLPHETVSAEYVLEYGVDALEMHADALARGARVLVHDDLLATGGTARALCRARRAARRRGRRLRVPHRAGVPAAAASASRATTSAR